MAATAPPQRAMANSCRVMGVTFQLLLLMLQLVDVKRAAGWSCLNTVVATVPNTAMTDFIAEGCTFTPRVDVRGPTGDDTNIVFNATNCVFQQGLTIRGSFEMEVHIENSTLKDNVEFVGESFVDDSDPEAEVYWTTVMPRAMLRNNFFGDTVSFTLNQLQYLVFENNVFSLPGTSGAASISFFDVTGSAAALAFRRNYFSRNGGHAISVGATNSTAWLADRAILIFSQNIVETYPPAKSEVLHLIGSTVSIGSVEVYVYRNSFTSNFILETSLGVITAATVDFMGPAPTIVGRDDEVTYFQGHHPEEEIAARLLSVAAAKAAFLSFVADTTVNNVMVGGATFRLANVVVVQDFDTSYAISGTSAMTAAESLLMASAPAPLSFVEPTTTAGSRFILRRVGVLGMMLFRESIVQLDFTDVDFFAMHFRNSTITSVAMSNVNMSKFLRLSTNNSETHDYYRATVYQPIAVSGRVATAASSGGASGITDEATPADSDSGTEAGLQFAVALEPPEADPTMRLPSDASLDVGGLWFVDCSLPHLGTKAVLSFSFMPSSASYFGGGTGVQEAFANYNPDTSPAGSAAIPYLSDQMQTAATKGGAVATQPQLPTRSNESSYVLGPAAPFLVSVVRCNVQRGIELIGVRNLIFVVSNSSLATILVKNASLVHWRVSNSLFVFRSSLMVLSYSVQFSQSLAAPAGGPRSSQYTNVNVAASSVMDSAPASLGWAPSIRTVVILENSSFQGYGSATMRGVLSIQDYVEMGPGSGTLQPTTPLLSDGGVLILRYNSFPAKVELESAVQGATLIFEGNEYVFPEGRLVVRADNASLVVLTGRETFSHDQAWLHILGGCMVTCRRAVVVISPSASQVIPVVTTWSDEQNATRRSVDNRFADRTLTDVLVPVRLLPAVLHVTEAPPEDASSVGCVEGCRPTPPPTTTAAPLYYGERPPVESPWEFLAVAIPTVRVSFSQVAIRSPNVRYYESGLTLPLGAEAATEVIRVTADAPKLWFEGVWLLGVNMLLQQSVNRKGSQLTVTRSKISGLLIYGLGSVASENRDTVGTPFLATTSANVASIQVDICTVSGYLVVTGGLLFAQAYATLQISNSVIRGEADAFTPAEAGALQPSWGLNGTYLPENFAAFPTVFRIDDAAVRMFIVPQKATQHPNQMLLHDPGSAAGRIDVNFTRCTFGGVDLDGLRTGRYFFASAPIGAAIDLAKVIAKADPNPLGVSSPPASPHGAALSFPARLRLSNAIFGRRLQWQNVDLRFVLLTMHHVVWSVSGLTNSMPQLMFIAASSFKACRVEFDHVEALGASSSTASIDVMRLTDVVGFDEGTLWLFTSSRFGYPTSSTESALAMNSNVTWRDGTLAIINCTFQSHLQLSFPSTMGAVTMRRLLLERSIVQDGILSISGISTLCTVRRLTFVTTSRPPRDTPQDLRISSTFADVFDLRGDSRVAGMTITGSYIQVASIASTVFSSVSITDSAIICFTVAHSAVQGFTAIDNNTKWIATATREAWTATTPPVPLSSPGDRPIVVVAQSAATAGDAMLRVAQALGYYTTTEVGFLQAYLPPSVITLRNVTFSASISFSSLYKMSQITLVGCSFWKSAGAYFVDLHVTALTFVGNYFPDDTSDTVCVDIRNVTSNDPVQLNDTLIASSWQALGSRTLLSGRLIVIEDVAYYATAGGAGANHPASMAHVFENNTFRSPQSDCAIQYGGVSPSGGPGSTVMLRRNRFLSSGMRKCAWRIFPQASFRDLDVVIMENAMDFFAMHFNGAPSLRPMDLLDTSAGNFTDSTDDVNATVSRLRLPLGTNVALGTPPRLPSLLLLNQSFAGPALLNTAAFQVSGQVSLTRQGTATDAPTIIIRDGRVVSFSIVDSEAVLLQVTSSVVDVLFLSNVTITDVAANDAPIAGWLGVRSSTIKTFRWSDAVGLRLIQFSNVLILEQLQVDNVTFTGGGSRDTLLPSLSAGIQVLQGSFPNSFLTLDTLKPVDATVTAPLLLIDRGNFTGSPRSISPTAASAVVGHASVARVCLTSSAFSQSLSSTGAFRMSQGVATDSFVIVDTTFRIINPSVRPLLTDSASRLPKGAALIVSNVSAPGSVGLPFIVSGAAGARIVMDERCDAALVNTVQFVADSALTALSAKALTDADRAMITACSNDSSNAQAWMSMMAGGAESSSWDSDIALQPLMSFAPSAISLAAFDATPSVSWNESTTAARIEADAYLLQRMRLTASRLSNATRALQSASMQQETDAAQLLRGVAEYHGMKLQAAFSSWWTAWPTASLLMLADPRGLPRPATVAEAMTDAASTTMARMLCPSMTTPPAMLLNYDAPRNLPSHRSLTSTMSLTASRMADDSTLTTLPSTGLAGGATPTVTGSDGIADVPLPPGATKTATTTDVVGPTTPATSATGPDGSTVMTVDESGGPPATANETAPPGISITTMTTTTTVVVVAPSFQATPANTSVNVTSTAPPFIVDALAPPPLLPEVPATLNETMASVQAVTGALTSLSGLTLDGAAPLDAIRTLNILDLVQCVAQGGILEPTFAFPRSILPFFFRPDPFGDLPFASRFKPPAPPPLLLVENTTTTLPSSTAARIAATEAATRRVEQDPMLLAASLINASLQRQQKAATAALGTLVGNGLFFLAIGIVTLALVVPIARCVWTRRAASHFGHRVLDGQSYLGAMTRLWLPSTLLPAILIVQDGFMAASTYLVLHRVNGHDDSASLPWPPAAVLAIAVLSLAVTGITMLSMFAISVAMPRYVTFKPTEHEPVGQRHRGCVPRAMTMLSYDAGDYRHREIGGEPVAESITFLRRYDKVFASYRTLGPQRFTAFLGFFLTMLQSATMASRGALGCCVTAHVITGANGLWMLYLIGLRPYSTRISNILVGMCNAFNFGGSLCISFVCLRVAANDSAKAAVAFATLASITSTFKLAATLLMVHRKLKKMLTKRFKEAPAHDEASVAPADSSVPKGSALLAVPDDNGTTVRVAALGDGSCNPLLDAQVTTVLSQSVAAERTEAWLQSQKKVPAQKDLLGPSTVEVLAVDPVEYLVRRAASRRHELVTLNPLSAMLWDDRGPSGHLLPDGVTEFSLPPAPERGALGVKLPPTSGVVSAVLPSAASLTVLLSPSTRGVNHALFSTADPGGCSRGGEDELSEWKDAGGSIFSPLHPSAGTARPTDIDL
mgnify:CR=1 FL=1